MIRIIYPENKLVTEDRILSWYNDAVEDGEIEPCDTSPASITVHDAAMALDDAGIITLHAQPFQYADKLCDMPGCPHHVPLGVAMCGTCEHDVL